MAPRPFVAGRNRGSLSVPEGVEETVREVDGPGREEERGQGSVPTGGGDGREQQGPAQRDEGGVEAKGGRQPQEVSEDGDGFLPNPAMPA